MSVSIEVRDGLVTIEDGVWGTEIELTGADAEKVRDELTEILKRDDEQGFLT